MRSRGSASLIHSRTLANKKQTSCRIYSCIDRQSSPEGDVFDEGPLISDTPPKGLLGRHTVQFSRSQLPGATKNAGRTTPASHKRPGHYWLRLPIGSPIFVPCAACTPAEHANVPPLRAQEGYQLRAMRVNHWAADRRPPCPPDS